VKPSPWLVEFYHQWRKVRGHRIQPASRAFSLPWEDLLDTAGLRSSFERDHAREEAKALEKQGRLILFRHRIRREETLSLPPASEPWLLGLFNEKSAQELRNQALSLIDQARATGHRRWPESWTRLCENIHSAFMEEKSLHPFSWKDPAELAQLLSTIHALTSREWPPNTLIRDASVALGLESKFLEQKCAPLESALSRLFGEPSSLESLGILNTQSQATVHGSLTLHFDDASPQPYQSLQGPFTISLIDLKRAAYATTPATHILSIENAKTTFLQAAVANSTKDILLIATSYPNSATSRLLALLPPALPHHHFGDTDASGYAILGSLRKTSPRSVQPFLMQWRDAENSPPLSEHDRRLLPSLMASPSLQDCHPSLQAMANAGRKGHFEQEAFGAPTLKEWPFWSAAARSV